ncbi:hypothetical protein [Lactiplantibacillus modestisalitolerans]|uniref:Uncharacterized protein n=1 Tax=Lactiplantibacillus modestisalitolerans TaxID=1457219 RepID=A0ABV5WTS7_9LACO|nr:hypothetical protein [Lactiplantibacillus modestisalitolerans]
MSKYANAVEEIAALNGAVYFPGTHKLDYMQSIKHWIAIYFNGGRYKFEDFTLTEDQSEDFALGLVHLMEKIERTQLRRLKQQL